MREGQFSAIGKILYKRHGKFTVWIIATRRGIENKEILKVVHLNSFTSSNDHFKKPPLSFWKHALLEKQIIFYYLLLHLLLLK